jgi:4-alpha-glucanotransferase
MDEFRVKQSGWLEDFALFMAQRKLMESTLAHLEKPLTRSQVPFNLEQYDIAFNANLHSLSFIASGQVRALAYHSYQIIGDIPIFVAR